MRRLQAVAVGTIVVVTLWAPGYAWADTPGASPALPTDLWIAPLAGGIAALFVALFAALKSGARHLADWRAPVKSASAWDVQDSWVTNITALGGTLTAVFSATAIASFFKSTNTDGFTVLSLFFGGATVMGPVIYGALSSRPTVGTSSPTGTRAGAIVACFVTLFAAFGLMADIGQLVSYTIGTTVEKSLVYVAVGIAALFVGIYAVRSVDVMLNAPASAGGMVAASMMTPAPRTSGTL
jgi:hypothetical protein